MGEVISHETIPDGTILSPGERFEKTWKIRNPSGAPYAWPVGTKVTHARKEKMSGPDWINLPPAETPAGTDMDVTVSLVAPMREGRSVGFWRLISPSGVKFGQR